MSDSRPEVFEIGPGAARVERRCLIVGIAVLALAAALGYASVSYTHLTLPTKA